MARIGKEASRICDHADEFPEHAEVCERFHLFAHAVVIVVKPPGRAELNFGGHFAALEIAEHGAEDVIVFGVQAKQHGFGEVSFDLQRIHKAGKTLRDFAVVNGIKTGVGTQTRKHFAVVVAHRTHVQFHYPAAAGVFRAQKQHQRGAVFVEFCIRKRAADKPFFENLFNFGIRRGGIRHIGKRVVTCTAAVFLEQVHAFQKRGFQFRECVDFAAQGFFHGGNPRDKRRQFNAKRFVRAKRREHTALEILFFS